MERYRLKNIIILILALVNVFLLGSLTSRRAAEEGARRRATEQLVALFAADGVELDAAVISREQPPAPRTLDRDTELDRELAAFLLGEGLARDDQGGGLYVYTSAAGVARFESSGSFHAAGQLAEAEALAFCQDFCKTFQYRDLHAALDEDGSGTVTAVRDYGGYPVLGSTVSFTVDHGAVIAATGTLLSDRYTETPGEQAPLSAAGALTAFQQHRRETGAVVSQVTDMYLCFDLQSTSPILLTPAWCVVTDSLNYYVNCFSGAISHS